MAVTHVFAKQPTAAGLELTAGLGTGEDIHGLAQLLDTEMSGVGKKKIRKNGTKNSKVGQCILVLSPM